MILSFQQFPKSLLKLAQQWRTFFDGPTDLALNSKVYKQFALESTRIGLRKFENFIFTARRGKGKL